MLKKKIAFTLLLICCSLFQLMGQNSRRISGNVIDSAKTGIPNVKVKLITNKDTLNTMTDEDGKFRFSKINSDIVSLQVSSLGYIEFTGKYTFTEKERQKQLEPIQLKMSSQMLKEVVIKGKPNPVRFLQDTVEYNAAAYQVNEGDNVADLLKQFPGLEIDDKYNVKTMGKEMVKLRINGKDFFTNNVKDFIGRLPAGIVSKIQVIDDFGDEANFTGIKVGEPIKMLNIVTKPGMNRGVFGNISGDAGTNDMIGSGGQVNLWKESRQSSANANVNSSNNGAGNSRSIGIGLSHNDKLGKNSEGGFNYSFNNNGSAFSREQVLESLNPEGNSVNNSKNDGKTAGGNHNLGWNINYNNKKMFVQGSVNGSYGNSDYQNSSVNNQYGLNRQDIKTSNSSKGIAPNISASINLSKKLKNTKNSFSARTLFALSGNNSDQNINTSTRYYDKITGEFKKDSILNRDLNSKFRSQHVDIGFNYSIGLKKPKDTLGRQSINISYNGSADRSFTEASTFVFDNNSDKISFVDSLSTSFQTTSLNQSLGISYNYNANKMHYNFGINARPNILINKDMKISETIRNNTFNYSPNLNFSRNLAVGKTFSVNYQGANNNPTINQLQPLRNAQNLQNIIVGNPNLKSSFNHNLNTDFNYVNIKSGKSFRLGVNALVTQREIVEHVILTPDTLESFKQITRYENVNGNYQFNGNYDVNIPIRKNKYSLSYSGTIGFSNRAVIFNNKKAFGKGLNFSQRLSGRLMMKKFSINSDVSYSITNNNNTSSLYNFSEYQPIGIGQINAPAFFKTSNFTTTLNGNLSLKKLRLNASMSYNINHNDAAGAQSIKDIGNLNMNFFGHLTVRKSYFIDANITKRTTYGYAFENPNPLIINANLGKSFLKDKSLSMSIRCSDLLGQGNNISRVVTGNTIIDSRNKQQTRLFSINLSYDLSRFGGQHFRVDQNEFNR